MNTKALLVAFAIVAAGFGLSTVTQALAQNMTGGENMTITMTGNMTAMGDNITMQPLEDENMTAGG